VVYADCDLINGSLACCGVSPEDGAVLDVLSTADFTLLARHIISTRSAQGSWVLGNAWALAGERLLFVPQTAGLPIVWSYALDGVSLTQYLPATEQ
jgi:hypothetical protein